MASHFPSSTPLFLPVSLLTAFYYFPSVSAYTWAFQNTPKQCSNLTLSVSGSGGVPPYRILILPFGPSPLAANVEARTILDIAFDGQSTSLTFPLKYPANSQFVAVVSDSKSFGSGGTSVAAQVTSSDDASCFDAKIGVAPEFVFSIVPANQVVQCQSSRIWWDPSTVKGTPNFLGVIPGGQSFSIPENKITDVPAEGTGFSWVPSVRGGTTLIIVGGDDRGNGTAGSSLNVVSSGLNDVTCLSDSSPSSTPGSPAGGSYPTGPTSGGSGNSSGGSTNVAAIAGGVVAGLAVVIIALLLFWFIKRRQKQRRFKERPVDLLNADEDEGDESPDNANGRPRRNELPQYYRPEPFLVPDPTLEGSVSGTEDVEGRRPLSGASSSFYTRATTPDPSLVGSAYGYGAGAAGSSMGEGRRKGTPRPMRAVNFIQHDDAGPSLPPADKAVEDEPETIELPPAYTAVGRGTPTEPTPGTQTTLAQ